MKNHFQVLSALSFAAVLTLWGAARGLAGDDCVYQVTADSMPPNVIFLLDNGAEMKHVVWHGDFHNSIDFTPTVSAGSQADVVANELGGNGFFCDNGYGIFLTGGTYYLARIKDDLTLDTSGPMLQEAGGTGSATWTINGRTLTLPAQASAAVDSYGIKDNAGSFRYSKNYLNWLFFSGNYLGAGADLPRRSRFYYAKKALLTVGKLASNKIRFAIYSFSSNADGASNVQPIGEVVDELGADPASNILDPNYVNNINNMGTVLYSPLAEGLARIGGYIDSPSFGTVTDLNFCQKTYVIVVSPGISSKDTSNSNQAIPATLNDFDQDGLDDYGQSDRAEGTLVVDGISHTITSNIDGSTYLDDVAHYMYTHDMRVHNDPVGVWQNVSTYTVGLMAAAEHRLFLINTSNNGNGYLNLTTSLHPNYGKYHFDAEFPEGLAQAILDAVNDILSRPNTFVAPVVPVTRTRSGDKIYMAFFTPMKDNFWQGVLTKFHLSPTADIIDADGLTATWPNGALRDDAQPIWSTLDWADLDKPNGIHNASRSIYTYLGKSSLLTEPTNSFSTDNHYLTSWLLGDPVDVSVNETIVSGRDKVINFVRGADVLDEDADKDTTKNRSFITGDVLHSEPVIITYQQPSFEAQTYVFFGANDGMLHAVFDQSDPDIRIDGDETSYGEEAWAFIPPDQLSRLKYILEGTHHSEFVDSSPRVYFHDVDGDGFVDTTDGDQIILICGEREGGTSYFALDITNPQAPAYLWRIDPNPQAQSGVLELDQISHYAGGSFQLGDTLRIYDDIAKVWLDAAVVVRTENDNAIITYDNLAFAITPGQLVGNQTADLLEQWIVQGTGYAPCATGTVASVISISPDVIVPELGQSWSVPEFGIVKTDASDTEGTPVFFIGGGYSEDNSSGKAVIAIDVFSGNVVRKFTVETFDTADSEKTADTAMQFSVASTVRIVDGNDNGFIDKIYVGDLGGQLWRFGQFDTDESGDALSFPEVDENINRWTGHVLFSAPTYVLDSVARSRKFFYPPNVTQERVYDLVFIGTGDRELACSQTTAADRIYCVKDDHDTTLSATETDLVDVTNPAAALPDLNSLDGDVDLNGTIDRGWFIRLVNESGLAIGEKVLAEGTVFNKVFYITTFIPNYQPCMPGGSGRLYALNYMTGKAVLTFGNDADGDGVQDLTRSVLIGGGIPSKPVMVLSPAKQSMLISIGSTRPNDASESLGAGVVRIDPLTLQRNFYYLWWKQLFS